MSDKSKKEPKKDWKKFKEEHAIHEESGLDASSDASVAPIEENDAPAALDHPSYIDLEEKLTLAEQQLFEHREKAMRAMAEVDNIRRRAERDVSNAHRYALEKFSVALLPVVDSLEQALQLADKSDDTSMREGLELTMQLFVGVLEKFGVKQLNPIGEVFDPQQHEAMSMQPSADVAANTVLMVFQKGYVLSERVIRPARVVVSKDIG
jgi:molecular chaperone GrpE